ncbi:MAG TPA: hypothetical protein VN200_09130, partial [Rhodoglobus sp.]|nr:hypothetical protein [Rhodoglobus sp.]
EQRREAAVWSGPSILVIGAAGSGVSTALHALSGDDPLRVPDDPVAAWDALAAVECAVDRDVLVDDLDALLARLPLEYRTASADRLAAALRDGARRGLRFAIGTRRITGELQTVAALCAERLYLRHASRQDVLLAGGSGEDHLPDLPVGGGVFHGRRVQVVHAAVAAAAATEPEAAVLDERPLAVVSTRPSVIAATLPCRVLPLSVVADPLTIGPGDGLVGDPDEWQSRWGALPALRQRAQVVLDACGPAEFRALTRSRELPPLLPPGGRFAWRWEPDGSVVRVDLSQASTSARSA